MAIELKVGDRIKDNDPRSWGGRRVLTITNVESPTHIFGEHYGAVVRIRRDRIHADGKPRRSGFSLVTP